jgi:hypothetical protein
MQQDRLEQSSQKDKSLNPSRSVLEGVWDYLDDTYLLIDWKYHLDRARGIRDE